MIITNISHYLRRGWDWTSKPRICLRLILGGWKAEHVMQGFIGTHSVRPLHSSIQDKI